MTAEIAETAAASEVAVPDVGTVTWHGLTIRVPLGGGSGSALRFSYRLVQSDGKSAQGRDRLNRDPEDPAGLALMHEARTLAQAAVYELLQSTVGAEQVDAVLDLADTLDVTEVDLIRLAGEVNAVRAARPTKPSTGSSDGRSPSGDGSTDSGSGGTATVTELTPREMQKRQEAGRMGPVGQAVGSYV